MEEAGDDQYVVFFASDNIETKKGTKIIKKTAQGDLKAKQYAKKIQECEMINLDLIDMTTDKSIKKKDFDKGGRFYGWFMGTPCIIDVNRFNAMTIKEAQSLPKDERPFQFGTRCNQILEDMLESCREACSSSRMDVVPPEPGPMVVSPSDPRRKRQVCIGQDGEGMDKFVIDSAADSAGKKKRPDFVEREDGAVRGQLPVPKKKVGVKIGEPDACKDYFDDFDAKDRGSVDRMSPGGRQKGRITYADAKDDTAFAKFGFG